jgi:hypothetical protein
LLIPISLTLIRFFAEFNNLSLVECLSSFVLCSIQINKNWLNSPFRNALNYSLFFIIALPICSHTPLALIIGIGIFAHYDLPSKIGSYVRLIIIFGLSLIGGVIAENCRNGQWTLTPQLTETPLKFIALSGLVIWSFKESLRNARIVLVSTTMAAIVVHAATGGLWKETAMRDARQLLLAWAAGESEKGKRMKGGPWVGGALTAIVLFIALNESEVTSLSK